MRCYYQLVNYTPSSIPNPDIYGRRQPRCMMSSLTLPTTFEELKDNPEMQRKANVLQYRRNQTQLSKNMIYSKKINGKWTKISKTYATQGDTFTNPNTQSLLRTGGTLTSVGGNATSSNTYCVYNPELFPSNQESPYINDPPYAYSHPPINTQVPPPVAGPILATAYIPPPVPPSEEANYVAPVGGVLACSQRVDTTCETTVDGQTVTGTTYKRACYPAYMSDVPGPAILCWDEATVSWNTPQTYTVTTTI